MLMNRGGKIMCRLARSVHYVVIIFVLLFPPNIASAETANLTAYHPAPFGAYDQIQLVPRTAPATPCAEGTMYVDSTSHNLQYCNQSQVWIPAPSVWSQSGTDIYPASNANANIGIRTNFPAMPLHIVSTGDPNYYSLLLQGGGVNFSAPDVSTHDLALYRGGNGFGIFRHYGAGVVEPQYDVATILQIWAPPGSGDREATLSVVRDVEGGGSEFFDLYNNGYGSETQYGIRIQKRTPGNYRDFVIDQYDGVNPKTPLMIFKANGNVGVGSSDPGAKLDVNAPVGIRIYTNNRGIGKVLTCNDDTGYADWKYPVYTP